MRKVLASNYPRLETQTLNLDVGGGFYFLFHIPSLLMSGAARLPEGDNLHVEILLPLYDIRY
jgi:hypothetical protein